MIFVAPRKNKKQTKSSRESDNYLPPLSGADHLGPSPMMSPFSDNIDPQKTFMRQFAKKKINNNMVLKPLTNENKKPPVFEEIPTTKHVEKGGKRKVFKKSILTNLFSSFGTNWIIIKSSHN